MKEPELCQVTGRPLPEDLAGYQCVMDGSIRQGDLLIDRDTKDRQWAICDRTGHEELASFINDGYNVYRKIPCPKAGGLDHLPTSDGFPFSHTVSVEEAKTYDEGKPPLAELPWDALEEVSMVQLFGFKKYEDFHNYRKGMRVSKNIGSALRHIARYMMGEDLDKESGLSHLAHAACRLLFVLQNIKDGVARDNRYKPKKP